MSKAQEVKSCPRCGVYAVSADHRCDGTPLLRVGTRVRVRGSLGKMEHDGCTRFCAVTEEGETGKYRGPHPGRLGAEGWHLIDMDDGTVVPATPLMFDAETVEP